MPFPSAASPPSRLTIGIFDSGVGGLSVLREIRVLLPEADLLYIADSAHVPYGNKTPEFIVERARTLTRALVQRGAQAIVIACNTATAAAAPTLRAEWPQLPIIGMEPAVKPAAASTKTGVVGVLATVGTLASSRFAALLADFAKNVRVVTLPAPGLPEAVERGALDTPETRELLGRYVRPLLEAEADTIVLGCTHYAFLKPALAALTGPGVTLIDTGPAVAQQLRRRLIACGLLVDEQPAARPRTPGKERFWTTGDPAQTTPTLRALWRPDAAFLPLEEAEKAGVGAV